MATKAKTLSKDAARALFWKLIREAPTMDKGWRAVRRAFPRDRWGKVQQITRALSEHRTFTAAYAAVHKRGASKKKGAARHAA